MNPWMIYSGLIVAWGWVATIDQTTTAQALALAGAGLFTWTFIEYALHRWILHGKWQSPTLLRLTKSHLSHETATQSTSRPLTLELRATLPIYLICLLGTYFLTFNMVIAGLITTGLSIGYLFYESVHLMTHQEMPRSSMGRALKRYHFIHHYAEPNRAFGLTSPLWDIIFNTRPKRRSPLVSASKQKRVLTRNIRS